MIFTKQWDMKLAFENNKEMNLQLIYLKSQLYFCHRIGGWFTQN